MVLPIYRNHLLGPLAALFLGDDFIPYVFKAKNLGVTFSYMILIGVIILAQSAVRSMGPSLGLGDWQISLLSPFVCECVYAHICIYLYFYFLEYFSKICVAS
jgi:hypothetical protein